MKSMRRSGVRKISSRNNRYFVVRKNSILHDGDKNAVRERNGMRGQRKGSNQFYTQALKSRDGSPWHGIEKK